MHILLLKNITPILIIITSLIFSSKKISYYITPAKDYNKLFNKKEGWTGSDAAFSIPLNGDDYYNSKSKKTLWLFGDTPIGTVNSDNSRNKFTLIPNSLAILEGKKEHKLNRST